MKKPFRILFRLTHGALLLLGFLALLFFAAQFTRLPWRAYKSLFSAPTALDHPGPTHILIMGGSGIPGESGLTRTYYGAQAAAQYPDATVLVAMPFSAAQSDASRAYLDELKLRGVSAGRMHILDGGHNTREQAVRLAETLVDCTNEVRVLIVTDAEHIRRTAACIREACKEEGVKILLGALPAEPFSIEDPVPGRTRERPPL